MEVNSSPLLELALVVFLVNVVRLLALQSVLVPLGLDVFQGLHLLFFLLLVFLGGAGLVGDLDLALLGDGQ